MNGILRDLLWASPPLLVGLALTWRLIWPWWKIPGKVLAYFVGVALLSWFIGSWSVALGWLHQGLGLGFHIFFCHKHGFTWYAVEDPARYVALSKAAVGVAREPPSPS